MKPTLVPGDLLIATSLFKNRIKKKTIIVFFDKTHSFIVKRVTKRYNEHLILQSDNLKTSSIFCINPLPIKENVYMVILKINLSKIKKFISFDRIKLKSRNI